MSKSLKYFMIAAASLGILAVVAVAVITTLVDVESYKPKIEQLVTEKTGYPLTLGGKISLSLFPWVGLSFADLKLNNPKGFDSKTFVSIDGFQARLKLLPLLSRKVEISKFVMTRPEIFLEKSPKGVWNWQKLTEVSQPAKAQTKALKKAPAKAPTDDSKNQPSPSGKEQGGFALQSLVVGEFSITDGRIQLNDLQNKVKREVSDFSLQLEDVSLDKPIKLKMAGLLDGKALNLKGSVGPVGPDPGVGRVNVDLVVQILDTLNIKTNGYLTDLKGQKKFQLSVNIESFNPREIYTGLGLDFPVKTTDPKVLETVGFKADIAGDVSHVVLSDANVLLDDSLIKLTATAKDFAKPDLIFNVELDSIDLDRYLPPGSAENKEAPQVTAATGAPATTPAGTKQKAQKAAIDYGPLRKLVLVGTMKLDKVKVHGGTVTNVAMKITGRNGLFALESFGMDLYEGKIAATGKVNVQKNRPVTALNLTVKDVQAGPLLKDFAGKEVIEGLLKADVALTLQGDNADLIKQSLNGKGDLVFQDGALIGLDLAQMARTITSGFSLEQQGEKPKTDFAELHAPFTISNGLVNTSGTTLQSPFIRVAITGDANLVSEALDMKVKPTLVGTIKGQGDAEKREGLTIPVKVGGTFKKPQFSPDLGSIVKDRMPNEQELSEIIKTGKVPEKRKEEVEQVKGLLKGLFGK